MSKKNVVLHSRDIRKGEFVKLDGEVSIDNVQCTVGLIHAIYDKYKNFDPEETNTFNFKMATHSLGDRVFKLSVKTMDELDEAGAKWPSSIDAITKLTDEEKIDTMSRLLYLLLKL